MSAGGARPGGVGGWTVPTRWSVVRLLAGRERAEAAPEADWVQAWEYLCRTYRAAMEEHVRRILRETGVVPADEAADIVQGFLLECLSKDFLVRADPGIGRFRTFIRLCLKRYCYRYVAARNAQRRRPESPLLALEPLVDSLAVEAPEQSFDKDWVDCMLSAALERVRGRSALNADLLAAVLRDPSANLADLAPVLGIPRRQLAVRLHRSKRMLAEEMLAELRETVADPDELERERGALEPFLAGHL